MARTMLFRRGILVGFIEKRLSPKPSKIGKPQGLTRHFSAHIDLNARLVCGDDYSFNQAEHGWMQRRIEMSYVLISSINCESVLS